jgi:hypothetical protein
MRINEDVQSTFEVLFRFNINRMLDRNTPKMIANAESVARSEFSHRCIDNDTRREHDRSR